MTDLNKEQRLTEIAIELNKSHPKLNNWQIGKKYDWLYVLQNPFDKFIDQDNNERIIYLELCYTIDYKTNHEIKLSSSITTPDESKSINLENWVKDLDKNEIGFNPNRESKSISKDIQRKLLTDENINQYKIAITTMLSWIETYNNMFKFLDSFADEFDLEIETRTNHNLKYPTSLQSNNHRITPRLKNIVWIGFDKFESFNVDLDGLTHSQMLEVCRLVKSFQEDK